MLKDKYNYSEPIFIEDLTNGEIKELNELHKNGVVKQFEKGIYYFWKTMVIGGKTHELPLRGHDIVVRKYLTNGNEVYGYTSGHTLRNLAGLTRQVPSFWEITSNNESAEKNDFRISSEWVITHHAPTIITKDNAHNLQFLDLMTLAVPEHLDEISLFIFNEEWLKENPVVYEELLPYVKLFPEVVKRNLEHPVIREALAQI